MDEQTRTTPTLPPDDLPIGAQLVEEGEWPWPEYQRRARRNRLSMDRAHGERLTGWEGDFLEAFRNSGLVRSACLTARVSSRVVSQRRADDLDFSTAYEEAREQAADALEAAAWQRAVHGVRRERQFMLNGKLTTEIITTYSDSLLMFLLRGNRPKKFREQVDHNHNLIVLEQETRRMARERGVDEEAAVAEARRIFQKSK